MILETVTILYYSLATISIGIVLYQKYNKQIHTYINKWLYNYEPVPNTDEYDLNLSNNLNNDSTYILFSDELNNELNNDDELNNEINNNLKLKTKKNILIKFV